MALNRPCGLREFRLVTLTDSELREQESQLLLVKTIDEVIETIFGKRTLPLIYNFLKKRLMLEKNEVPMKAKVFSQGLHQLFGSASSQIELRIAKRLSEESGMEFDPGSSFDFADFVAGYKALVKPK